MIFIESRYMPETMPGRIRKESTVVKTWVTEFSATTQRERCKGHCLRTSKRMAGETGELFTFGSRGKGSAPLTLQEPDVGQVAMAGRKDIRSQNLTGETIWRHRNGEQTEETVRGFIWQKLSI